MLMDPQRIARFIVESIIICRGWLNFEQGRGNKKPDALAGLMFR
jgi:hypothetical protein